MADQISTVTIPCWVIQFNNTQYTQDAETVIGKELLVPCRDVVFDPDDYWAVPIKDSGIFTGLEYVPKTGVYLAQPTYDSFTVFRIRDKFFNQYWWIYGTKADFIASCATCCGDAAVPMPGLDSFSLRIAPCQEFCVAETNGTFRAYFGIPSLSGILRYFPYGSFNNVALTAASGAGYASTNALLTFLNANWINFPVRSPQPTAIWSIENGGLVATFTNAIAGDYICMSVITVDPSA